ncbi:restriction endonuclease subunit S [Sinorhizobium fredii]|uniref:restriction endonuclease subunit S n=1 Tax=Rhizobium fredii TaxID=380 RepID=UPI00192E3274|nr:restriction endonuclease subunit S [Sinorhizobium fredii]
MVLDFFKLQRGFDLTKAEARDGPIPVYSSSGISYFHDTMRVAPPGIVTGRKGAVGPVYFVETPFWPHDTTLWVTDFKKSNPKFVWYFLQWMDLSRLGEASSVPTLNRNNVHRQKCVFPPLPEQKKIAEILSTWDKAIETTEKRLANAEAQKQSLMQQLLTGKRRLKGFSGPWLHKPLAEISTRIQRKTDGGDHPILTISSTIGFVRQDQKYRRYMAGKSVENYILLRQGEFAYNKGNSKTFEFGCVFDLNEFPTGLVPHVYVCFRLREGLSRRFFKALFAADYLRPQLGRLVNTGVRNNGLLNISPSQFLTTQVPVPAYAEQEAIGAVLEEATALEVKLKSDLELLRLEKSALMQQLLSGKRRVVI